MSAAEELPRIAAAAPSRLELWSDFLRVARVRQMAEIGVFAGEFAAAVLERCGEIERYHLIDPWRHLGGWNKPANRSDEEFERIYAEALARTDPWRQKRIVLRGTTTEVIDRLPDAGLDFVYVDGDHTLRGIAIDLIAAYGKVREGGWIGGDDFCPSIWQHGPSYEPTLVFPFAVHFAEAVGQRIFALPHDQFLLEKRGGGRFELRDLTGRFGERGLDAQLREAPRPSRLPPLARRLRRAAGRRLAAGGRRR